MGHTKVWLLNIFGTNLGFPQKNKEISPKTVIERFYNKKIKIRKENYIIFSKEGKHEIHDEGLENAKTSDHEIYILGGHGLPNKDIISNSLSGNKLEKIDAIEILSRLKKLGFAPEKSTADIKFASCFSGVGDNKNSLAGQFREKIDYECYKIKGYKGRVYGYTKSLKMGYEDFSEINKGQHKWVTKKHNLCGIKWQTLAGRWSEFRKQFDSDKKILDELDKLSKSEKKLYTQPDENELLLFKQTIELLTKEIELLEEQNSLLKKVSKNKNIPKENKEVIIKI